MRKRILQRSKEGVDELLNDCYKSQSIVVSGVGIKEEEEDNFGNTN